MTQRREWATRALLDFQSVMEQFLATERDVLRTYLSSARASSVQTVGSSNPPAIEASIDETPINVTDVVTGADTASPGAPIHAPQDASASSGESSPDETRVNDEAHSHDVDASFRPNTPDVSHFVRLTPRPLIRPIPASRAGLARERAVLITEDGRGVAAALAERLRQEGYPVALVGAVADGATNGCTCSFEALAEVEHLVDSIASSCRGIAAIVHLLPLQPAVDFDELTPAQAWDRLAVETRSLFMLAKATRSGLLAAAADGGAAVVAVTAMGGAFATDLSRAARPFSPVHGGVVGLTKCLSLEWPQVRVRAVDVDGADPADVLAAQIFDELWAADPAVEVGYSNGDRVGIDVEVVTPVPSVDTGFTLPSDAVILATGGARGITAETCLELASRYHPTFVLVGQAPLPPAVEPRELASLATPADLKRALMERIGRDGTRATVPMVEKAYQQVLREREIRHNIGALTATGARVHYVSLDIRDDDAFAALIGEIYATYGRLDGLIHGAGIIEDKLVQDKSVESFERVLQTKTRSAFVLSRCLRPESLRFAVFFSSVAGRFGNRGQGDYAAANEVVNKLAVRLDRRWPTRVCSINWAPWDKRGMVSPELKREFMERGVGLLDPPAGRRALWEEIQQPRTAPPEVVVAASTQAALVPTAPAEPRREKAPLIASATRLPSTAGAAEYERLLDPAVDHYLRDHRLDGRCVLPLAFATELMAEAAQATWSQLTVHAVRDLQLLKGIALDDAPLRLIINVRTPSPGIAGSSTAAVVDITTPSTARAPRYRAVVELGERTAVPPAFTPPMSALQHFTLPLLDAYRLWTFHGPAFQRITAIAGLGSDAIVGTVYSASSRSGLATDPVADWVIDPFVFDCALQMLLMWSRAHNDKTALPSRFRAFRRFGSLSDTVIHCHVAVESLAGGHALRSDVHFVGPDGRVLGTLEGMEASCTAALNRLTVQ